MELQFGVTEFYKNHFGDIPEINIFCQEICEIAKKKEYASKVDRIHLLPLITPEEMLIQGLGKEFKRVEISYKVVLIGRQIDFNTYQKATIDEKKVILLKFLFKTLGEIQKKIGFDLETFKEDVSGLI